MLSCSVMSNSLRPHRQQRARLFCPSLSPRIFSNVCPLSQWYHPTISSFVIPLLLLPSIFPSSRVLFQWIGSSHQVAKSIGASASASVLPMIYSGLISFRIDWFDLLAVHGTLKSLLQHHNAKASVLWCSAFWFTCGFTSYLEWSFNETAFSCSMHADFSCLRTRTHLSMCLGVLLADFRVPRSALEILKSSILSMLSFFF